MSFNVAVDGPAGAGKSTIAKTVAKRLHLIYIDTGAMYRAMALYMLRNGISPDDAGEVVRNCENADIKIRYENGGQVVYLNGENVNSCLRTEDVGNATSVISAIPEVRQKMVEMQRSLASENDCIMDGRDIGTCVLPDAALKIYLTADSSVRAKRRYDELTARGVECDLKKILADIEERDYRDMHREVSPLTMAQDAVLVDTSDMTIDEVTERLVRMCMEKMG